MATAKTSFFLVSFFSRMAHFPSSDNLSVYTRISIIGSWPPSIVHPTASVGAVSFIVFILIDSGAARVGVSLSPLRLREGRNCLISTRISALASCRQPLYIRPAWLEPLFPGIPVFASRLPSSVLPIASVGAVSSSCPSLATPVTLQTCKSGLFRLREELELPCFQAIAPTPPRPLPPCCPVCFSSAAVSYPAGTGSAQIRRSMAPNSRRVRCPSASNSQ